MLPKTGGLITHPAGVSLLNKAALSAMLRHNLGTLHQDDGCVRYADE
jgi:hypothetical protein